MDQPPESSNPSDIHDNDSPHPPNPDLALPYELQKTHARFDDSQVPSTTTSSSTDLRLPASELDSHLVTTATAITTTTTTAPSTIFTMSSEVKPCHNYFLHNNHDIDNNDDNNDHHLSSHSLSDYPTDEQTLNTLNSLNSYHRRLFGMDDDNENVVGDVDSGPCLDRTVVHDDNNSCLDHVNDDNCLKDEDNNLKKRNGTIERNKKEAMLLPIKTESQEPPPPQQGDDEEQQDTTTTIHSSNSSMENHAGKQPPQPRENRTSILEMAKRRMFLATRASGTASRKHTDGTVENVDTAEAISKVTDDLPHTNENKTSLLPPPSNEEGSFLNDAIVENILLPSLTPSNSSNNNNNSSQDSLPTYNMNAMSTMSQSTMTTSTQRRIPNNLSSFVNMGGDIDAYDCYSSPKPIEYSSTTNYDSLEATASPSTVVASGSRRPPPLIGMNGMMDAESSGMSSNPGSSESETTSSTTASSTTNSNKNPSKAQNMYASILAEASKPTPSHSRTSSVTSTEDRIWQDSNLAVQHLHHQHSLKDSKSQDANATLPRHAIPTAATAAAITPVRRNASTPEPSLDSYSYNQAFQTMDNITTHPELSLPTSLSSSNQNNNPFEPNLPEDYSFCPTKNSTFSTLTDDYVQYYDVTRRTGITAVAEREDNVHTIAATTVDVEPISPKPSSGHVDVDTHTILTNNDNESFHYDTSSVARSPTIDASVSANWIRDYGNSEHLSSIIQYPSVDAGDGGEGEGYVDEEAAVRYASLHRSRRGYCYKVLIWGAVGLLAVSLAIVTFGVFLQRDERNSQSNGSLLGRPAETEDDDDGSLSGNESGLFPIFPEPIVQQPTSSPDISILATPISSILSGLSTNPPSIGHSTINPSSSPTLLLSEAPSSKPTPKPSRHPSSPPTVLTTSPTRAPSIPLISTMRPTFSKVEVENQTYTTKVKVSRDTYIQTSSSNWNYGTSEFLRVDQDPRSIAVLAFDINPNNVLLQPSRRYYEASNEDQSHRREQTTQTLVRVEEAKLRLYSLEDSDSGGEVYALSDARQWREAELTWDNARSEVSASGETWISSIEGIVEVGNWFEVDVTGAFDCCVKSVGSMYLNLLIQSDSSDGVTYASKEYESGSYAPELILTYSIMSASKSSDLDVQLSPSFIPTRQPTIEESASPTFNSTIVESTIPTYYPTLETLDIRATSSPLQTSFVPEGCSNKVDSRFPSSLGPLQESASVKVIFPEKDSYVRGGDFKDVTYGSSDVLELAGSSDLSNARKIIIGFDLASLLLSSTSQVYSMTLRIFIDSIDLDLSRTVSIFKLPPSIDWDEDSMTWESFGTPAIEKEGKSFQISLDDRQKWVDIDIIEFIDSAVPLGSLSLVLQNISKGSGNSRITMASRETCHSSKLVIATT